MYRRGISRFDRRSAQSPSIKRPVNAELRRGTGCDDGVANCAARIAEGGVWIAGTGQQEVDRPFRAKDNARVWSAGVARG
jgi:hypothetical protein